MSDDAPVDTDFTQDAFATVFEAELSQMIWRLGDKYASGPPLQEYVSSSFQSIDAIVHRMIKWEMASMRAADDLANSGESHVAPFATARRDWLICRIKKLVSGTESGLRKMISVMVNEINSGKVAGPIDPGVTDASIGLRGAMTVGRLTDLVNAQYDAGIRRWKRQQDSLADQAQKPKVKVDNVNRTTKPKRSTPRGNAHEKVIAALTKYHDYSDGSCLNQEPISVRELAELAGVAKSTVSAFLTSELGGWKQYRARCQDAGSLVDALKTLNGEFTPVELTQRFRETFESARKMNGDE